MTRRTLFKHVLSAFAGSVLARMPLAGKPVAIGDLKWFDECTITYRYKTGETYADLRNTITGEHLRTIFPRDGFVVYEQEPFSDQCRYLIPPSDA